MQDALDHLTDILIGLAILFLVPLIYIGLKQDDLIRSVVSEQTAQIVDETQSHGYLSKDMYEQFQQSLSKTGQLYDIKLEHKEKILEPEYRFRTIEEILEEQNKSFTGSNVYHYYPVSTNIPVVTDPIDNSGLTMNTETNASVLARSTNTPSTGHIHTDACFDHKHIEPYGTVNMTNIPVIMTQESTSGSLYDDSNNYIGYYTWGANIRCGVCNEYLYSFYMSQSANTYDPQYIYLRTYTYTGQYRTRSTNTVKVTLPGYNSSDDWWSTAKYRASASFNNHLNLAYTTGGGRINFPWPGFPKWDASGNVSYTPFTGCTNANHEKHFNPEACYPMGKQTKVHINAGYLISNEYFFIGDIDSNISFRCAECDRQIGYISAHGSSMLSIGTSDDDWRKASVSASFYGFDDSGNIKEYNTYLDSNIYYNKTQAQVDEFNKINYMAHDINWAIQATKDKIPFGTGGGTDSGRGSTWWTTTIPIDYPLPGIPQVRLADLSKLMSWATYRGCPYCGTFGTAYTCGKSGVSNCDKVIASITPTHPVQAVFTGEALITTVTVTYLDGSTKVAVASTDFNTNTPIVNKIVTLSLSDTYGNTKTCTITVTVVPRTKTCIHGHTYNLRNDGSDPGCPFCRAWLASLVIEYPTIPTFTIYRGTTLSGNGVTLIATYLDGRTERLETEYIDNLDKYYVGSQNVTISYKGHYVYLTVITKRNLKLCPVCHRHYELHPDDSDPGCPWCAARTPIFTGNVMYYYRKKYTKDILEALYEGGGIYRFTNEDFFKISVKSRRGSTGTRLISAMYLNNNLDTIHVIEGGYIREDGYYYK